LFKKPANRPGIYETNPSVLKPNIASNIRSKLITKKIILQIFNILSRYVEEFRLKQYRIAYAKKINLIIPRLLESELLKSIEKNRFNKR
jgi:hypothetical protein